MQSMQILDRGREDAAFGGSGALNRVVITNQVRIVAVDGREKTFIVGAAAPGGDANGMGAEDGGRIHPQMDDYFWMMPPPDVSYVSTNTGHFAQAVLWCDANGGDDANVGTENAPFKSIQKAVDAAAANTYTVIYAANPQGAFQIACTSGTADILAADVFIGMVIFFR